MIGRMMTFIGVALAALVVAVSSGPGSGVGVASAQDETPPSPASVSVTNGANPGEAVITWTAVAGASSYRVGWLAVEDFNTHSANAVWLSYFRYSDVTANSAWTVDRLTPGVEYYFIVGRKSDDAPTAWSSWITLMLNSSAAVSCPAACPDSGATPNTTFPAQPVNGDYDADDDGRIEIRTIAQLQAIRHDLDGNGVVEDSSGATAYDLAFPDATTRMGCPESGCAGYELLRDLDFNYSANASAWIPIGHADKPFTADFDGNGQVIHNVTINAPGRGSTGLFGVTGQGSNIQRVGLKDINVIGGRATGGLAGVNKGSITSSYVTGTVSVGNDLPGSDNRSWVGGLVGDNVGSVTASYSRVSVSGNNAGGLVGGNSDGTITDSYATGSVAAFGAWIRRGYGRSSWHPGNAGGLVGVNGGSITASYATATATKTADDGNVGGLVGRKDADGTAVTSYWDIDTSGLQVSMGGVGKITARLQSPTGATGIYAAWNEDWWDFGTARQYPVLKVNGLSVTAQR